MSSSEPGTNLLSGYRVIELGDTPGIFTGKLLSELGCEVVCVEPPGGHPLRAEGPLIPWGDESLSATWLAYATSIRSVILDVTVANGRAALDVLLDTADLHPLEADRDLNGHPALDRRGGDGGQDARWRARRAG